MEFNISTKIRLGVNIDHVATIRNARGIAHPDPIRAARMAAEAGADGITAHLREDRRHISDNDIERLSKNINLPLNLEMAATEEMLEIALKYLPHAVCIVPEKREEITTEGGLDAFGGKLFLQPFVGKLLEAGIKVSLFIDPDERQIQTAKELRVGVVELHTGSYADANGCEQEIELTRLRNAAAIAETFGIECHAGHGLNYGNVGQIAKIQTIREMNIGHFLIGEAIFYGLEFTIKKMACIIQKARAEALKRVVV